MNNFSFCGQDILLFDTSAKYFAQVDCLQQPDLFHLFCYKISEIILAKQGFSGVQPGIFKGRGVFLNKGTSINIYLQYTKK